MLEHLEPHPLAYFLRGVRRVHLGPLRRVVANLSNTPENEDTPQQVREMPGRPTGRGVSGCPRPPHPRGRRWGWWSTTESKRTVCSPPALQIFEIQTDYNYDNLRDPNSTSIARPVAVDLIGGLRVGDGILVRP